MDSERRLWTNEKTRGIARTTKSVAATRNKSSSYVEDRTKNSTINLTKKPLPTVHVRESRSEIQRT